MKSIMGMISRRDSKVKVVEDTRPEWVPHFNGLSPAEDERLAMLAEEAGEIVQAIGKIQRHGYANGHPCDVTLHGNVINGRDNRANLEREIGDLLGIVDHMKKRGDLDGVRILARRDEKMKRAAQYLRHQE